MKRLAFFSGFPGSGEAAAATALTRCFSDRRRPEPAIFKRDLFGPGK